MNNNRAKFASYIVLFTFLGAAATGCWNSRSREILDLPGVQALTSTHAIGLIGPRWSPDETKILALTPDGAAEGPGGAIYTVEPATGRINQVIPREGSRYTISGATWSKTGNAIAYTGSETNGYGVYLFDLASGQSHLIVNWANDSALSPAKDQIALWGPVDRNAAAPTWKLSVIDLADSNETVVFKVQTDYIDLGGLNWSRDGQKIAFAIPTTSSPGKTRSWYDIYTVDAAGRELKPITHSTNSNAVSPAWSPDGQTIAYTQGDEARVRKGYLWMINADGSCPVQILDTVGVNTPTWSLDGRFILFEYEGGIYTLSLEDEAVAQRMQGLNCK